MSVYGGFWRDRLDRLESVLEGTPMRDAASLDPIGVIRSTLEERKRAPRQGSEGAPDAWLEVRPDLAPALSGIAAGDEVLVITWLHRADRGVLEVHPRDDLEAI